MTIETFDFRKTPRWTLFKMLASALISRRLSLQWEPKPEPEARQPDIQVDVKINGETIKEEHF